MKKTRILAAVFAVLIAAVMFFAGRVPAHADGEDGPMLIAENPAESADHTTGTKAIAAAASTACTIKAVLDTPILTVEGELTESSGKLSEEIGALIYKG